MTREIIIGIFEKHREVKYSSFDEEHFLDYLMAKPSGKGAIHNSFCGLRRFNKFWNEIQLTFGICFSLKDRDKNYSLDDFVKRIEQLKNNPKSSRAALKYQMKFGFEWNIFISVNSILGAFIVWLFEFFPITALLTGVLFVFNFKLIKLHLTEKKYLKKLEQKIGA